MRCRDLTCRRPGCTAPIERCAIDHTVPWPNGLTHPSNTKLFCRIHHLVKTFGTDWSDRQEPDGTITLTAPNGRTYTTGPGGAVLPATGHADRDADAPADTTLRGLARTRTRAQNLTYRIAHERALNLAAFEAKPPPF